MEFEELAPLFVSRCAEFDTATVWVGDIFISVISYNGSHDEDLAMDWALQVDDVELYAIYPLDDGRDFQLMRRMHVKQGLLEAVMELQEAVEKRFP